MFLSGKIKRYFIVIFFFGLSGVLWGWEMYTGPETRYPLSLIGGISLGFFSGLTLSIFSKNWKIVLRRCGLGVLYSVSGFLLAAALSLPLLLIGTAILLIFPLPNVFIELFSLPPRLKIASYWLNFSVAGIFIGLFFAFALKTKVWPMILRGAIGFGISAIISPIIGNLLGNLFNSILISYLITFFLIGVISGIFMSKGIFNAQKFLS